mmetsp:Transcript_53268/g.124783  ORF Transcript_53268/g.124783 Transcript_53268/m.124783 type:complete len:344 (+) Transcript_53268:790-1821(+)
MLLLSGLCGLRHGLVERLDAISQCLQLFGECGNGLRCIRDRGIEVLERLAKLFDLIVSGVELPLTIFLLVVIVQLLLAQDSNKVINEREDLLEAHLAARERHGDEVQSCLAALLCSHAQALHHGRSLPPLTLTICNQLQEAGAWQGLLEEFQRVIIIQDLDGFGDCQQLIVACLRGFLPLTLLGVAVLLEVRKKLLVLSQALGCVFNVIANVDNLNTKLADPFGLGLNGLCGCGNLLLLRCHKFCEGFFALLLLLGDVSKVAHHVVLHLLQDTCDLPTLWSIAFASRKECSDCVSLIAANARGAGDESLQNLSSWGLNEAASNSLLQGCDRLRDGVNIDIVCG